MYAAAERYLTLLNKFGDETRDDGTVDISVDDLAQALYCTARNVKIILRKLIDDGLIEWHAGRGRGNRSRIAFLAEREPILLEWTQHLAKEGEYKQAFEAIQTYGTNAAFKEKFLQWLNGHFGFEAESSDGKPPVDVLRFPVNCAIRTLDPRDLYFAMDAHLVRQIFDQLLQFDTANNVLEPGLAHAWESSADATEYTLHLRKGIKFHHGREMTAEDVVFTFERLRGDEAMSWLVDNMAKVGAVGPRTVKFSLRKPNRIFLRYLCSAGMSIVPKDLVQEDESKFRRYPIGSGPFRVSRWTDCRIDLEANPDYYKGRAHLDRVTVVSIPTESENSETVKAWEQLAVDNQLVDHRPHPEWMSLDEISRCCVLLSWNMHKEGPQQSRAFRRAIDLLIDRARLIRELGEDRLCPAFGYRVSDGSPDMPERFDPASARKLLAESGYDGRTITLSTYKSYEKDARWIARQCKEYGIDMAVSVDFQHNPRDVEAMRRADLVMCGTLLARDEVCEVENYAQSGNFMRETFHPSTLAWVTARTNDALSLERQEERRVIFKEIENRLRDESHIVFLFHKKLNTYVHPTVRGVRLNYLGWSDFKDIWLENRPAVSPANATP